MKRSEFDEKYPCFKKFLSSLRSKGGNQQDISDVLFDEGLENQAFSHMANYIVEHFFSNPVVDHSSGNLVDDNSSYNLAKVLNLILNYLHQLINNNQVYTITTEQQLWTVQYITGCVVSIPQ